MQVHNLGLNGSRNFVNKIRFNKSIIDNGVCVDSISKIAANVHILENSIVNRSKIESYTYLGKNSLIQNSTIGKFCSIANDVLIGLGAHPIYNFSTSPIFYKKNNPLKIVLVDKDSQFQEYKPIVIGHDVWIGTRAIVLDGVSIGTGSIIAANSVVTKDVPPYAIVAGSPARIIRFRFDESKIKELLDSSWWELDINLIKDKKYNL